MSDKSNKHGFPSNVLTKVSVVCTQPRRVAAIAVAERVAVERGEQLGRSVGFQVRMEHKLPRQQGSILYCTAGILLQRMQNDRRLKQFTHIVLDEVHERDVMVDLILVILKQVKHVKGLNPFMLFNTGAARKTRHACSLDVCHIERLHVLQLFGRLPHTSYPWLHVPCAGALP